MDEEPRTNRPPARRDAPTPPSGSVLQIPRQRSISAIDFVETVAKTIPPSTALIADEPSSVTTSEIMSIASGELSAPPPAMDTPGLDACLERVGVAVIETDDKGRVVRMNEAAERILRRRLADGPILVDEVLHTGVVSSTADGPLADGADTTGWIQRDANDIVGVRHAIAPREGAEGALIVFRESHSGAVFAPTIARRARYDPLTGLYSRRGILERIDEVLKACRTSGGRHALCYIDLDRFRLVNATCGHDAGDDLLQWVATRLYEVLPAEDCAARIAGDEFAILLTDHDARDAERVAREIQRRLSEFRFAWGHKTFLIDSSLGLFPFGIECDSADAAMAAASHACRVAKKSGGARLQVYLDNDEEMAQSRRSMEWVAGIQHHLASGKLQLYAQTIHPIGPREQGGHFEILMRVLDEKGRPQSPVGIIQAAENGRVMDAIDRFVVKKAFQTIGALPRRALRKLDLFSVNLSAISLAREGLLDFIVENLERSAVPPGKVCFEITETAALNNLDEVRWLIQELGAMGCRFAIDDFGSGHASYGYIERLPVDYVKIDGMFVKDMMTNALHRAIVESVNRIATTLGIKTIAECVETAAAAEVLAGMGVHYGQGWYYARPAPIGDVCKALDVD
ncbi:MAG: EAL domain-containing protein [Polyangiaceae bacterium]